MPRRKDVQIYDGEWVTISWMKQHEKCCKCNLQHVVDYRVVKGKLQFRASRLRKRR